MIGVVTKYTFIFPFTSALALLSTTCIANQILEYEYDAQGRVIVAKDNQSGDRNYFYDAAGNRTNVTLGVQPSLVAPTGLKCSQIAPNVYQASWSAVVGATYYLVRSNAISNPEKTTTSTSIVFDGASCKWVQACNPNACGAKSNF